MSIPQNAKRAYIRTYIRRDKLFLSFDRRDLNDGVIFPANRLMCALPCAEDDTSDEPAPEPVYSPEPQPTRYILLCSSDYLDLKFWSYFLKFLYLPCGVFRFFVSDEPGPEPIVPRTATFAPGEEVVLGLEDRANHHLEWRLAHAQALRPQGSVDAGGPIRLKLKVACISCCQKQ